MVRAVQVVQSQAGPGGKVAGRPASQSRAVLVGCTLSVGSVCLLFSFLPHVAFSASRSLLVALSASKSLPVAFSASRSLPAELEGAHPSVSLFAARCLLSCPSLEAPTSPSSHREGNAPCTAAAATHRLTWPVPAGTNLHASAWQRVHTSKLGVFFFLIDRHMARVVLQGSTAPPRARTHTGTEPQPAAASVRLQPAAPP